MKRTQNSFCFTFPLDGVMLTDAAGERIGDTLKITARVDAAPNKSFTLNGEPLPSCGFGMYKKDIILDKFKNTLTLVNTETGETLSIDVYYLKKGYKKYRFSFDDVIWSLQEINENKDVYTSIFEQPFFKLIKTMHDKWGTKFHANIYYETPRHGGFNLSQMTDKFKEEWIANSDWLKLCFHANADKPNRPYAHVSYEQMYFECERVIKEIYRFAGKETHTNGVMTLHFGDCSVEGARALRDLGYNILTGGFFWNKPTGVDTRQYLDTEQCNILTKYGFYYDKEEDIYFFRHNGGIQHRPHEEISTHFDNMAEEYPFFQFKDIVLHEQYFYPEYAKHQPNYYEKMDETMKWCHEHGFESVFTSEIFDLENNLK